jgi:hypothetical protein
MPPRVAVVIGPVSANSLYKTGVFREWTGDFPPICLGDFETGNLETKSMREKPGFPGV